MNKNILFSLYYLFHGKKYNILNQRIDQKTNYYFFSSSQYFLLLGVLFFIIILFLFPTILIYYLFFTWIQFLLTGIQAIIWWTLATLQCCPYKKLVEYFIMNKIKKTQGIYFQIIQKQHQKKITTTNNNTIHDDNNIHDMNQSFESRQLQQIKEELLQFSSASNNNNTSRFHHTLQAESFDSYYSNHSYIKLLPCPQSMKLLLFTEYRRTLSFIQQYYTAKSLIKAIIRGFRLPVPPPPVAALLVTMEKKKK